MALYDRKRIITFLLHITVITLALEIIGEGHLAIHPIVMGAVFLSYYDLWVKKQKIFVRRSD